MSFLPLYFESTCQNEFLHSGQITMFMPAAMPNDLYATKLAASTLKHPAISQTPLTLESSATLTASVEGRASSDQ